MLILRKCLKELISLNKFENIGILVHISLTPPTSFLLLRSLKQVFTGGGLFNNSSILTERKKRNEASSATDTDQFRGNRELVYKY